VLLDDVTLEEFDFGTWFFLDEFFFLGGGVGGQKIRRNKNLKSITDGGAGGT
jgi:hypothetical protein